LESDPTHQRFVAKPSTNVVVKKTTYRDNPYFSQALEYELLYLQSVDDDSYRWIWEGLCRTISDALILKGKFTIESFEVQANWSGPHHGLDLEFSRDPSAAVRLCIDDTTKNALREIRIVGRRCRCPAPYAGDGRLWHFAARPILRFIPPAQLPARNGVPRAVAAAKWSGSVNDVVAYLRSFNRIIIDPACQQFLAEARTYSYKVDRLTGLPLPEVEDRNIHLMDATRYALSPLIRNLPLSGFFSRSAILSHGQPVDDATTDGRPQDVFAVLPVTDRPATAVGLVTFAHSSHHTRYP
jgi:phage terminase large subunit